MKKKLLFLALLCAVVQGAWAQNGIYCTASDVGRVLCTNGSIYDNVSAATAVGGSSYGDSMTDVSKTSMTYSDGSVTVTNEEYSGTLAKADAETAAEIGKRMTLSPATNSDEDVINPGEPNRPAGARSHGGIDWDDLDE